MFTRLHPTKSFRRGAARHMQFGLALLFAMFLGACAIPDPSGGPPAITTQPATTAPTEVASVATPVAATDATDDAADHAIGAGGLAAFVRDGTLYIVEGEAEPAAVEDCSTGNCFIYHLRWSSSRQHLLYYVGSNDGSVPHQIRLVDSSGNRQTVTEGAAFAMPAGWSWDGTEIAYRTDTDRYAEGTDGPASRIQELWTVSVDETGALGTPTLQGEITFGEGCGGGGRSESATAYEREGGFAYGYLAGIMLWTPDDVLLYSDNCTTRGVSRFDIANQTALDPLPGALRSLSLNAAGDQWVAINDANELVMGTPTSDEIMPVATNGMPELVALGQVSGTIYYTTWELSSGTDLIEQASATLDQSILIFPYFDDSTASLVALDSATGIETILYSNTTGDAGYAFARIHERADGSVIFSSVEDNAELQAAVENETLTAENWRDFLPTVDVMHIPAAGGSASVLLADAEQYTPMAE